MADGTVYIDTDVDGSGFDVELSNLRKEIKRTEIQLDKLIEKQIRFVETGGNRNSRVFQGMEYDIEHTRAKLENLRTAEVQLTQNTSMSRNAFEAFKRTLKNFIPNVAKATGTLVKMGGKGVLNGLKKLGARLKSIGKHTKSGNRSMLKMLGSALLIGTAMRALFAVMNSVKEGMNNLAQYSSETNQDLSLLKSSLTQLKNSFATAFAPILSVVTPILNSLINSLSKAMTYIGMFMASLTGKGTFVKAIEVQEDYAAGLDSSADSAKDAEKANKGYLSGLDEITKFQDKDSANTSGNGKVSPSEMFEEVEIDNSVVSIADIFKQKIAEGDWKGIGSMIAQKINEAISKIDFKGAGQKIGNAINKLLDSINGFLEEVDWQMIGHKVADFVARIDWSGIAHRCAEGIGAAFGGAAGLIWGFIELAWNEIVAWWQDNAYEDGEFTMQGLLNGMWEVVKNIGAWIRDRIFFPFIDGFCKAFGIHSPSTVMKEMGRYLMQGLLIGVSSFVDRFVKIKDKIAEIFTSMGTAIRNRINNIITFLNRMIAGVTNGINSMISSLNALSFTVPDWLKYVPGASSFAGKSFGFNIGYVGTPQIPYLATGAVIPPNAPFMAMLGDQKNGRNLEMPEKLLRQIVREESGNGNRSGNATYRFTGQINRRVLFDEFIEEAKLRQIQTGKKLLEQLT